MRRTIALLMFPYFVPLVTLSILGFVYMLVTPSKPSDGTGPAGSDVLGLFFIGTCIILGGIMQITVGLALNAMIMRLTRFSSRLATSIVSVLIPVALYALILLDTPSTLVEAVVSMIVVILTFGFGAWFVSTNLKRNEVKSDHRE